MGSSIKTKEKKIIQPDMFKTLFAEDWIIDHGRKKTAFFIHAWRFAVLSGLRRGELAGLRLEDINGDILHIDRAVNCDKELTPGKNDNSKRYLVLSPRMTQIISDQKQLLKASGIISPWIFPSRDGTPNPNSIYKGWTTYRNQRGWDEGISVQSMRRTMVSVANPHLPLFYLKSMVGHSESMDTLGIYGCEVDGEMKKASMVVADVFETLIK